MQGEVNEARRVRRQDQLEGSEAYSRKQDTQRAGEQGQILGTASLTGFYSSTPPAN